MADEGEGGHSESEEGPAWNNLWGHKEQGDQLQVLHDAPDSFNGLNKMFGWTSTQANANLMAGAGEQAAERAAQASHLAQNAEAMGNDSFAAKFASRASSLSSTATDFEAASQERGLLNAVMENPAMSVGGNLAGAALGGLSIYNGVNEWSHGNKTQGGMDIAAGGLGVGAGALGAAGGLGLLAEGGALAAAGTVAAPVALVAGLAAAGNSYTKDHDLLGIGHMFGSKTGLWGENPDGTARDSLQFVGQSTSSAYNAANKWAGGGVGGAVVGGLAGAGTAIGTGAAALVGDVAGGVAAVGSGLGHLGAAAGQGIWNGAKWLGSGIGNAASAVGNGIGNAASAVGSGISHAASAVGNGIGNAASAVGSGVSSAFHAITSW